MRLFNAAGMTHGHNKRSQTSFKDKVKLVDSYYVGFQLLSKINSSPIFARPELFIQGDMVDSQMGHKFC